MARNREANIIIRLRDRATSGLRSFRNGLNNVVKAAGLAAVALAGIGAITGTRFLRGAIQTAGDFGQQMSVLQGLTGETGEGLQRLEDRAREMGATTRFSAIEAGQGLEELIRGGQGATDAIESLNPVLDLAAGNNQEVAESAQQVVTALNAYNLAATESGRVADVYTRAAQSSAQTTGELAEAMTNAAPVASGLGMDIETTAALIGRLADQGFRGSRGGVALRNVLLDLDDPASKFRQELQKLGIESTDFVDVLEELEAAGPNAAEALRALGRRGGPEIRALVASGTEGLRELQGELRNAGGAANEAAVAMENNLPGAFRSLNAAMDDLRIELVDGLVDNLKNSVFDLAETVRRFTRSESMQELKALLVETFQAGREAVEEFVRGIDFDELTQRFSNFIKNSRDNVGDFREQVSSLGALFGKIVGGVQIFVGGLQTLFNATGAVIAKLIELSTKGVERFLAIIDFFSLRTIEQIGAVRKELDGFAGSFEESVERFSEATGKSVDKVVRGWDRMVEAGQNAGEKTGAALDDGVTDPAERAEIAVKLLEDQLFEVNEALFETGNAGEEAGDKLEDGAERGSMGWVDLGNGLERVRVGLEGAGGAAEEAGDKGEEAGAKTEEGFERVERSSRRASASISQVADTAEEAGSSARGIAEAIADALNSMRGISEGASEAVNEWVQTLPQLQTIESFFRRLSEFNQRLTEQYREQVDTSELWIRKIQEGSEQYLRMAENAIEAGTAVDLLDQANLDQLSQSVRNARAEMERFQEETRRGVETLEDELLRLQGKEEELEKRRMDRRRREIELELAQQGLDSESRNNLERQLKILDEITREKEKQQRVDEQAERTRERERRRDSPDRSSSSSRSEVNVTVRAAGGAPGAPQLSQADMANLASQLKSQVLAELRADQRRTL